VGEREREREISRRFNLSGTSRFEMPEIHMTMVPPHLKFVRSIPSYPFNVSCHDSGTSLFIRRKIDNERKKERRKEDIINTPSHDMIHQMATIEFDVSVP
jgi:hypothetical protein